MKLAAVLLCSGCFAWPAAGQRVVVLTQTYSAVREAASVYLQSADFTSGSVLPGPLRLPGHAALGPLLLSSQGQIAHVTSATPPAGRQEPWPAPLSWRSTLATTPFGQGHEYGPSESDWKFQNALALSAGENDADAFLLLGTHSTNRSLGRLQVYGADGEQEWDVPLPGAPIEAARVSQRDIVVLCQTDRGPTLLRFNRGDGTRREMWPGEGTVHSLDASPVSVAVSESGRYLFVLVSGYALANGLTEPRSWVYCVAADSGLDVGAPVEVPGMAGADAGALQASGDESAWVLTTRPGTPFGHATQVTVEDENLALVRAHSLPDAGPRPRIAPGPRDLAAAAALGRRLEIWPLGARSGVSHEYPEPITVLEWTSAGLFAGGGNRLYKVDPATAVPAQTLTFQSGFVVGFAVAPAAAYPKDDRDGDGLGALQEDRYNTSQDNPDTDGDGVHDGIDPEPLEPSPALHLPAQILFRGDRAGRELRGFPLQPNHGRESVWQVENPLPWLNVRPLTGRGWSPVFMGIDPARYAAGGTDHGRIEVRLQGTRPAYAAAGSPQSIFIGVTPVPPGPARILWIWDEAAADTFRGAGDVRGMKALGDLLAGPPHYFIQHELSGPIQAPLAPYNIVVLEAAAAARGAVTRQAVLDYVAGGGALLFLGAALPEAESRPLVNWLQPAGMRIRTEQPVAGTFPVEQRGPLTAHWDGFRLDGGSTLEADAPGYVQVPAPGEQAGVLLARDYGYGRMALLAADDPLRSAALAESAPRLFAQDLFQWLVRAGFDVSDMDGDGLPDSVEDPNDNGQRDPGETHYLLADTDADGIPDGMEDLNRNGVLDEGETDPRNRDTDSDGIFDGADASPVPIVGAPYLQRLDPAEGPAEGGALVLLTGRNFVPGVQVRFGERPVGSLRYISSTMLLAETPPYPEAGGGTVSVGVAVPSIEQAAELADAYDYTSRTKATLRLRNEVGPNEFEGELRGSVVVSWETGESAAVKQIFFLLQATPGEEFWWQPSEPAGEDGAPQPEAVARPLEDGSLIAVVLPGEGRTWLASGDLLWAGWRYAAAAPAAEVRVTIERASVQLTSGELLDVTTEPLTISLQPQAVPVPRREVR
jgi:hypothetical protein